MYSQIRRKEKNEVRRLRREARNLVIQNISLGSLRSSEPASQSFPSINVQMQSDSISPAVETFQAISISPAVPTIHCVNDLDDQMQSAFTSVSAITDASNIVLRLPTEPLIEDVSNPNMSNVQFCSSGSESSSDVASQDHLPNIRDELATWVNVSNCPAQHVDNLLKSSK